MPVAADNPDAAPKPGDDTLRIAFHAAVLLALLALAAYCVIWAPRRRAAPASTASSPAPSVVIPPVAKGIA